MLKNLPSLAQKRQPLGMEPKDPLQFKFNTHTVKDFSTPFYSGMIEAEPIILTPQEEGRAMKRYLNSQGDKYPVGTIVGAGDHPKEATPEQIEQFRKNREEIVPPMVKQDIRSQGGIFHGKHNLNREYRRKLGKKKAEEFIQETYDYDVWVGNPRRRADMMQRKLDKKMKCDIAYAVKQPAPHDAKARWIVRSRANMDNPEVDYVGYPDPIRHPYRTRKERDGIEYETIESSMAREEVLKHVPMRSFKARRSLYNYQKYKNYERGKK